MTKESYRLYYNVIHEFKRQYYGPLLRYEHLVQRSQIRINNFYIPGQSDPIDEDFWGYHLIKDGINYLIASHDGNAEEINIEKLLPIEIQDAQKLADSKGNVYFLVRRPVPMRFIEDRKFTAREFMDNLSLLQHSSPDHQKIIIFMALTQLWDRANFRVATPAGFGKDGIVDICSSFFGGCGTIESPTIAKLEDRASVLKWLAVNEVVDISKEAWDIIQQFLLSTGAHKNEVTKRSRAFQNVDEIIDTSRFSISLFYNDIDHYPNKKTGLFMPYFDDVTKRAVIDRFPAFRFYGKYTEDFNSINKINVANYVKETANWDFFIDMIKTFLYFKKNYLSHTHNWDRSKMGKMSGRDGINLGRLLTIVDLYCNTQEEFDSWIQKIQSARYDYVIMLQYPGYWGSLVEKVTRDSITEDERIRKLQEYQNKIDSKNTFEEKINFIKDSLKSKTIEVKQEKDIFEFGIEDDIL